MRSEHTMKDDLSVAVVRSRRFQEGVEILEREVHLMTTSALQPEQRLGPRLVITDALASATDFLFSKTRAEVEGLNGLLHSLAIAPISSK